MFVKRQFVKKRYHGNTTRNTFLYYVLGLPPSIQLLIQITKDDNETALKKVTRKNRNFKIQRRRQQRERQINNWFYKQSTTFFVHFFACFCTTTTWKCLISRFAGDVKSDNEIQFLFLYLDMVPRKNNSRRVRQHLTKKVGRNNCDKDWKNANSLFKRHSHYRRVVGS